jgi:glycosyltransferase involved in cell wall biosynthesis
MGDLITIVIPTYNEREDMLRKAIETVLNQTYPDIELILVDDGCTDNTPEILQEYAVRDSRVRVFRRERDSAFRSIAQAFNIGLENARGKWWHHDAADCWHELDWAKRCMDFIRGRENEVLGVHTNWWVHHFDGTTEFVNTGERWRGDWSTFQNYQLYDSFGGMLFRMDIARKAGLWDPRFPRHQTREWTYRVLRQGDHVYLPRALWHFVFHEPDQMKRRASVKYRILADLKNGIDPECDLRISLGSEDGRYAVLDACRAFFTDPVWEPERLSGVTKDRMDRLLAVCNEEASESWHKQP